MEKWIFSCIMVVFVVSMFAAISMNFTDKSCLENLAKTERSVEDIHAICKGK